MREEVIGAVAQAGQNTRLEVALTYDEAGHSTVELRSLIWGGTELGWYRQQTIAVSGTTLRQLLHSLGIAQCRVGETMRTIQRSNVIPFPRERRAHVASERTSAPDVHRQAEIALTGAQREHEPLPLRPEHRRGA